MDAFSCDSVPAHLLWTDDFSSVWKVLKWR